MIQKSAKRIERHASGCFKSGVAGFLFALGATLSGSVIAADASTQNMTVDQRLKRLEAAQSNQNMVDLFLNMEKLQREVEGLRGEIEVLNHSVDQIKKQQKDLYQDLDQRIQQVEMAATAAAENAAAGNGQQAGSSSAQNQGAGVGNSQLQEQSSYQNAFEFLKQAQYREAVQAFQSFLQTYPGGEYADNAQYWLGEAYYVMKDFSAAMREFQKMVSTYPKSAKLADAHLKVGYCYYEMKDFPKAAQTLKMVTEKFANSTAARLADKRLQQMRLENKG